MSQLLTMLLEVKNYPFHIEKATLLKLIYSRVCKQNLLILLKIDSENFK